MNGSKVILLLFMVLVGQWLVLAQSNHNDFIIHRHINNCEDYACSYNQVKLEGKGIENNALIFNIKETLVSGVVKSDSVFLYGVEVKVFEEGENYGITYTDHDGRFEFQLNSENIYTISVKQEGFISKQITFIPSELEEQGVYELQFDLILK